MSDILTGYFAPCRWQFWAPSAIRVVNWNIDRGLRLSEITEFLASQYADLLILQEVDLNARRTHYRNIAEELARKLGMNYVFGREFEELTQGSRTSPAYHGQATLSRWRFKNPRVIRFRRQSGFWRPRWFLPRTEPFQERLGGRIALITEVDVLGRVFTAYNLHLESRGADDLRLSQLNEVLDDAAKSVPRVPALLAGDLNFDVSEEHTAALTRQTGFHNVLGQSRFYTRPARKLFGDPRSIDWAFVAGPVKATLGQVHSTVKASDHYPISFTLWFS
ncbi:MAG: endonuclease/exonuclease/phosphatase family protein [Acidobacteriaceae bacterium]|nr:endonuclease/exonuclease/phosphatase family protein [Acidobacteriaceae bacterium]